MLETCPPRWGIHWRLRSDTSGSGIRPHYRITPLTCINRLRPLLMPLWLEVGLCPHCLRWRIPDRKLLTSLWPCRLSWIPLLPLRIIFLLSSPKMDSGISIQGLMCSALTVLRWKFSTGHKSLEYILSVEFTMQAPQLLTRWQDSPLLSTLWKILPIKLSFRGIRD